MITWINSERIGSLEVLNHQIKVATQIVVLARTEIWEKLDRNMIPHKLQSVHAIHSGLMFGGCSLFEELTAITLNWNFLNPDEKLDNFSWKATEHFFAFRKEAFLRLGGLDTYFTLTAAIAEFCYRIARAGGLVQYVPLKENYRSDNYTSKTSSRDVLIFAAKHLGPLHTRLLELYFFFSLRPAFISVKKFKEKKNEVTLTNILFEEPLKSVEEYTAIIPTILRYDYITRSIDSLKYSEFPPREIIIVDQTPIELRNPEIYEPYIKEGILRVFYLDKPGQCTARNLAIREAQTRWLLFFEDDTEAWPGMMREHKYLIEHSLADVSTGVSLAPWKDESFIPKINRKYHVSDVLATGNCFMKKETALSVGGLHPAFDRGPGADDDFGRRLFLAGKLILFNHKAIQTHHKAPIGGMRVHGVWWRTTSKIFEAYPPVTQAFMIRRYYPIKYRLIHFLLFFVKAKNNKNWFTYFLNLILFPLKIYKSIRLSTILLKKFPAGNHAYDNLHK